MDNSAIPIPIRISAITINPKINSLIVMSLKTAPNVIKSKMTAPVPIKPADGFLYTNVTPPFPALIFTSSFSTLFHLLIARKSKKITLCKSSRDKKDIFSYDFPILETKFYFK